MIVVVLTYFCVIRFPLDGKVITIDQLALYNVDSTSTNKNIPLIGNHRDNFESMEEGMFKDSLMGVFPLHPPYGCVYYYLVFTISTSPKANMQTSRSEVPPDDVPFPRDTVAHAWLDHGGTSLMEILQFLGFMGFPVWIPLTLETPSSECVEIHVE